ncbi:multidrug transporter [Microbacterium aurantiacum]|uniref:Multidrug transporter n=1 Tax=Microbacterium aurantiacum TaxID=162393 RepID=A0ABT8FR07_9MICO|nr:multidrug transporter [Microbacterium aurantiacum]MDN4463527.1 multidrug transporter [Microbacterium aurantiacum]
MDTSPEKDAQRAKDRHDQLTTAPAATEEDAAPRIRVTEHDGIRRIDIDPDAAVRPGVGQTGADAEESGSFG